MDAAIAPRRRSREIATLFRHRDFLAIWVASTQSQIGDQLARVALSVLVFHRTGSGLATASTYALTYLPAVLGGVLLGGLADRWPRRRVLVASDVIRAALFAIMALPGLPLPALAALLAIAVLIGAPYGAAAPSVIADLFDGERYVAAQGVRTGSVQTAQLIGFAVGGIVVAAIGPHWTLLVDASTFAAGAIIVRCWLTLRPALSDERAPSAVGQLKVGLGVVIGDRRLRVLLGLAWLNAFWIVPEGLAAPYAVTHSEGPLAVGVLLAAAPAGNIVGISVLTKWVPARRQSYLLRVMSPLTAVPLIACVFQPPVPVAAALWLISGVFSSYLVLVITDFVSVVPAHVRAQATGVASSGLMASQGLGLLAGGVLVTSLSPGVTIAIAGGAGLGLALALALAIGREPRRSVRPSPAVGAS